MHPRRWSGDTHDDLGGSIREAETDALMAEAADLIVTLRAQLEAAEAEVSNLRAGNIAYSQQVNELIGRAGNAEARAEAAEADAARYQLLKVWGRQMSIEGTGECNFGITTPTWRGPWIDLDAAIDAAMARTKEQQA